ncbi:MAG: hypothetical protein PHN78_06870, partial [Dehalococcoidales bacterium]|nr:hypothetical protein [Dehalococcoidales bacterium]
MLRRLANELRHHLPFTALGTVSGIVIMVLVVWLNVPSRISQAAFYTLHPLHVVLSALVTTAMYKKYGNRKIWAAILVGYVGSIGVATLSDAIIPYLGGSLLNIKMEFEIPFIETEIMPVIG